MESHWQSSKAVPSKTWPGVVFVIARISFSRRLELMKQVRALAGKADFFQAGDDEASRMEASLLGAEIDRIFIGWGLLEIRGLDLDGDAATPTALMERGPEDLFREALEAVKAECGLSETERKN